MEEPTQTLTDDNFDVLGRAGRSRPEIATRIAGWSARSKPFPD